MTDDTTHASERPCGTVHPLPCGLDIECRVPSEYHDVTMRSDEIVAAYEADADE